MKNRVLIPFATFLISNLSWAFTEADCIGAADGDHFNLKVRHLDDFDGPYQKFVAKLELNNKRFLYSGVIGKYAYNPGYTYITRIPPKLSTENINMYDFSIFLQEPPEENFAHTEIRYHGRYSGKSECYPPGEMGPGGCVPIYVGKDGTARMKCDLK